MKSILMENKNFISELIDSTRPVISFDMYIMDEFLYRVAGTGVYKSYVGVALPPGCASDYVLKTKVPLMINNPLKHAVCQQCAMRELCFREYMIICPIFHDGQVRGTIGLGAVDDEAKKRMWPIRNVLVKYLENISKLISAKVREDTYAKRLKAVLDSMQDSVFLFDTAGNILIKNALSDSLLKELGIDSDTIYALVPQTHIDTMIAKDSAHQGIEITVQGAVSHKRMYASVVSVTPDMPNTERVLILKDKTIIADMAYRIVSDTSHLPIDIEQIKGGSVQIQKAKSMALKAAKHESTVLITGESGTGKELFARAIHQLGDRKDKPFVAINCAAIPDNLIESELFGYEDGAFTGAKKSGKPGKFELANGGTLFLDEIADLKLHLQPKLLRALQNGEIERVGGGRPIKLDIRLIAATNKNLEEQIKIGAFREDLYYRLNVFPIQVPPLRERTEDILLLSRYFLSRYAEKNKKMKPQLSLNAQRALQLYNWPGNVRELANAMEFAINMDYVEEIKLEHLPVRIQEYALPAGNAAGMSLRQLEDSAIREALSRYGTSIEGKMAAATSLNISLSTLYRRLRAMSK